MTGLLVFENRIPKIFNFATYIDAQMFKNFVRYYIHAVGDVSELYYWVSICGIPYTIITPTKTVTRLNLTYLVRMQTRIQEYRRGLFEIDDDVIAKPRFSVFETPYGIEFRYNFNCMLKDKKVVFE
jgi:hypothetical protein